jgi:precorrin-4/cobalt-precorrin-4 C11-methyltransferase
MVHFVGAGPGAVDLITLRGLELLKNADCVVYAGSLVNLGLLQYSKDGAEIYNSAYMTLDEITDVLIRVYEKGNVSVRLHTGDPSFYGAVREQMNRLDELRIPYGVCPGVSSVCAAAASLKAEYTLPGVSQSVVITRMTGRTSTPERENITSFASHGATMAIFLSAGMTEELQRELKAGGYTENTPAAIVYKASWADEKILRCTVGTLHETALSNNITKHALILAGDFLRNGCEPSKLYSSDFSTGFRNAERRNSK